MRQVLGQTSAHHKHDGQCDGGNHARHLGAGTGGLGHRASATSCWRAGSPGRARRRYSPRRVRRAPGPGRRSDAASWRSCARERWCPRRRRARQRRRTAPACPRRRRTCRHAQRSEAPAEADQPPRSCRRGRRRRRTCVAPTTAKNTPGNLGAMRRMPRITARQPAPIASVIGSLSSSPPISSRTASTKLSADTGMPSTFGSWVTNTVSAMPARYPMRTGFEIRSVTKPRRSTAASARIPPTSSASSAAVSIRAVALAPAMGMIAAATTGDTAESGPNTRMREGPKTKYASSGSIVAYKPVTAGSPASSAYAIPCGRRRAVRTKPATRSCRSQLGRYVAITCAPVPSA